MSRKARNLTRDKATFRDDRIFWIGTDDRYAPAQYLNWINFHRLRIFVLTASDKAQAAQKVVERLRSEVDWVEGDQKWAILDVDHHDQGNHLAGFLGALRNGRDAGIQMAVSKPCFELWLALHWMDVEQVRTLENAADTEATLRPQRSPKSGQLWSPEKRPVRGGQDKPEAGG